MAETTGFGFILVTQKQLPELVLANGGALRAIVQDRYGVPPEEWPPWWELAELYYDEVDAADHLAR